MKLFQAVFLLLTECLAKESKVSYPWNSKWTYGSGLSWKAHQLLKQGLKIGYLPPSRYNCKFAKTKNRRYFSTLSAKPFDECK